MAASSYVPGTLALMGSPEPDVLRMMYCALSGAAQAGPGSAASARRGLSRNDAGSPVASERSPMAPGPNSSEPIALRREIIASPRLPFDQSPMETADGARQAATKVDFSAFEALAPCCCIAVEKCAFRSSVAGDARGSDGTRPMIAATKSAIALSGSALDQ